ncbi:MAG: YkgJ family cysteine cluster protein [Kiritimatiellae bacterium]|nr:YkgJ family cysteine cluster protein [Kiritimatiellia bacterium]
MSVENFKGCKQCGECCRAHGYVKLRPGEAEDIAEFLEMPLYDFTSEYTRLTHDRRTLSLTENDNGSCRFLDGNNCTIDKVKPLQCRTFPFKWRFPGWEKICKGVFGNSEG